MGIYQQPKAWQCGPFALKHALLVHGILVPEQEIARAAGTTRHGTDEKGLGKAARKYGCELLLIRRLDPDRARRELVRHLRKEIPCLLPIEDWSHWATVVKEEKGSFILLDSQEPGVIVIATWPRLEKMWVCREEDEYDEETVHTLYDLHPVVPRGRVRTRADFSLERARYLLREANQDLARLWDIYVEDLLAICRPRTARSERVLSLAEFLRRHETVILEELEYWHGAIDGRAARKILGNFRFVADTYGLVIHEQDEKRAIVAMSVLLGLWAAAEYGIDPIYRVRSKKKRR